MIRRFIALTAMSGYKAYRRVMQYVEEGEYNKKHLYISRVGGKIEISLRDQDEIVADVQQKIDTFEETHDDDETIPYSLELALTGCRFITFVSGDKFVQFVTDNQRLQLNFPITKVNRFKKYYYPVLGWLAENNFVSKSYQVSPKSFSTQAPAYNTYEIIEGEKMTTVRADFHKEIDLASDFVLHCLREFMKTGEEEIVVTVG